MALDHARTIFYVVKQHRQNLVCLPTIRNSVPKGACAIIMQIPVKIYKKYSSQSWPVCHYILEICTKWINNAISVAINENLRRFRNYFHFLSRHFQRMNETTFSLFKSLQCQHNTVSRQHWMIGNALPQTHKQLLKMSFIELFLQKYVPINCPAS